MSVYSMAKLAEDDAEQIDYGKAIVMYIPSEALALYIFLVGILLPTAEATPEDIQRVRLIAFVLGIVAAVIIAFASFDGSKAEKAKKDANNREVKRPGAFVRPTIVAVLAAIAFAAYALASPAFFLEGPVFTIPSTVWGTVAGAFLVVILPYVGRLLGVR